MVCTAELKTTRRQKNLPDMVIPEEIIFTDRIEDVCEGDALFLFAEPSVFVRSTAHRFAPYVKEGQIIVDVAKGIEADTLMTMSKVIHSEIPQAGAVALSGPTHAEEVAKDLPTTIVSASIKTSSVNSLNMNHKEVFIVCYSSVGSAVSAAGSAETSVASITGSPSGDSSFSSESGSTIATVETWEFSPVRMTRTPWAFRL